MNNCRSTGQHCRQPTPLPDHRFDSWLADIPRGITNKTYLFCNDQNTQITTRKAWQGLAYSLLGAVVLPLANTNETHLLTDRHLAYQVTNHPLLLNVPKVTSEKISTPTVQLLCLKLRHIWTEYHQICTRYTEITVDYSAVIKIVIFLSVLERQRDEWRSSSNCGRIAAKKCAF